MVVNRNPQDRLFESLYTALRSRALYHLTRERHCYSISPTVLVHEAYLSLARGGAGGVTDQDHFVRLAGRAMRNLLVDRARRRSAEIHGGGLDRAELTDHITAQTDDPVRVIAVGRAMTTLEAQAPRLARIAELRYFCGFTEQETAAAMSLSTRQVRRLWVVARIRLLELIG
jgi:RNA polymerase sigma factor (TIGR02999 family)